MATTVLVLNAVVNAAAVSNSTYSNNKKSILTLGASTDRKSISINSGIGTSSSSTANNLENLFVLEDQESTFTFVALKSTALTCLVVWTIIANFLVFVVLYKNPRLQTVPNFLVANLAFSDLCLGLVVLPLSAVYAITLHWSFGKSICEIWLSSDVLCSTASIWNLSIIGLDRYWAITSPITYMTKRNMRSAIIMIAGVWALSMLISVAPFFGWRNSVVGDNKGNYVFSNETQTYQCVFLDLPAYTIYSATGSFYIPLLVMFFVYFQIYRAFAEHKARQIYRQKVIKKHIESTILHEISHVLPTSDEFAKERDDDDDDEDDEDEDDDEEEEDDEDEDDDYDDDENADQNPQLLQQQLNGNITTKEKVDGLTKIMEHNLVTNSCSVPPASISTTPTSRNKPGQGQKQNPERLPLRKTNSARTRATASRQSSNLNNSTGANSNREQQQQRPKKPNLKNVGLVKPLTYERVRRHKQRKERRAMMRHSLQKKPPAISAAKEKRGVKVLGIILGCFAICWTPFFIMYLVTGFCQRCRPNPHIEQFITWLGYSNSAMNPIIYTVFNRDYQNALKKLFIKEELGPNGKRKPGRLSKM